MVSPAAAATTVGVQPSITWGIPRVDVEREISQMKDLGVRWVRLDVNWRNLQPDSKGRYSEFWLTELDNAVQRARAEGFEVLLLMSAQVPYWASADPGKRLDAAENRSWNPQWRPQSFQDYADFAAFVARRYAPLGVHHYEVFNEPNLEFNWPSGPDPAEYAAMLRAVYPAVHAADPAAVVMTAGLFQNDRDFLQGLYAAGARGYFDAVATHMYPWYPPGQCVRDASGRRSRNSLCGIDEIRATMVANGDQSKPVFLTEIGYSTSTGTGGWTEQQQAAYLAESFRALEAYPWLAAAIWYQLRNVSWYGDAPALQEANFGLERSDWTLKPAYAAFRDYTRPPPRAWDKPPSVELIASRREIRFTRSLALRAHASDDHGVVSIEFLLDGVVVKRVKGPKWTGNYRAPRRLSFGRHVVRARAYDGAGQVTSSRPIVIRRVPRTVRQRRAARRLSSRSTSSCRRAVQVRPSTNLRRVRACVSVSSRNARSVSRTKSRGVSAR